MLTWPVQGHLGDRKIAVPIASALHVFSTGFSKSRTQTARVTTVSHGTMLMMAPRHLPPLAGVQRSFIIFVVVLIFFGM